MVAAGRRSVLALAAGLDRLLIWAQQSVLRRCGVPRGWKLGLVGVAVVLAVEPIRTTLGYGQVNTMLMALVVADLLPDRARGSGGGSRRAR